MDYKFGTNDKRITPKSQNSGTILEYNLKTGSHGKNTTRRYLHNQQAQQPDGKRCCQSPERQCLQRQRGVAKILAAVASQSWCRVYGVGHCFLFCL